jgi:hypothetical protein
MCDKIRIMIARALLHDHPSPIRLPVADASRSTRLRSRQRLVAAVIASLALATPGLAFEEPKGFGRATFGMSVEAFLTEYPEAQLLRPESAEADQPGPIRLVSYRLEKQRVGPLVDCRVDFRFFGATPELYEVQFLCPDREEAGRYLTTEYGSPQRVSSSTLTWTGGSVEIAFVARAGAFSFSHTERARKLQVLLIQQMGLKLGGDPAGAPANRGAAEEQP